MDRIHIHLAGFARASECASYRDYVAVPDRVEKF
jgi:hypothetical protein